MTLVGADELDAMTAGKTHGGFAARCSGRTIPGLEACPDAIRRDGFYVLPEGIEDPYNFAYTLRSLYAAGADGAILPPRNWMSAAGIVAKSSAGTSEKLPLFSCDPPRAAELFRSWGFRVICAGIRDSVDLYEADLRLPLLLVIGGEKRGISRGVLEHADPTVRIGYSDRHGFRGSPPRRHQLRCWRLRSCGRTGKGKRSKGAMTAEHKTCRKTRRDTAVTVKGRIPV